MKIKKILIKLLGLAPIMFDRFIDHSKEDRPPEQKLYLASGNALVLPAENIIGFLFGENPGGCAKTFEGKKGKEYIRIGQGHVIVDPVLIPLHRNGDAIKFHGFDSEMFWVSHAAPRTKQGHLTIKQPKKRPVLSLPWSLEFQVTLIENPLIDEIKLHNWFAMGGIQIALGTYRPRFGRFEVKEFSII